MFKLRKKLYNSNIVPRPLIYPEKKLALFFSAKAGSTFATKWFFFQQGILDTALSYNPWIHKYRLKVYIQDQHYKEQLEKLLSNDYIRIKLVRSPYKRTVSSYVHAIRFNHIDEGISDFLGRHLTDDQKFSFEEFIAFLESTGVVNCNPHNRVQIMPQERQGILTFHKIVKLENSYSGFRDIEKEFNLKKSDLNILSKSNHHLQKNISCDYCGDKILGRADKALFYYNAFYNKTLQETVSRLYGCDFDRYKYDKHEL